jgi:predicted amidohydrolase
MRDYQSAKYDALIYVANWPERRNTHWKSLLIARAIENQCYVVGVNRVGEDGKGLVYSGDSAIINAYGETISSIQAYEERIETIVLSAENLNQTRSQLAFLKDI